VSADAVVEVGMPGVADEGSDGCVDAGGAQGKSGEELFGQLEFVVGLLRVEEGDGLPSPAAARPRTR
jgi:hypothetical protein